MKITIWHDAVVADVKETSRLELAATADPELRYHAEVGTEKMSKIIRCIRQAVAELRTRCTDFEISTLYNDEGSDEADTPTKYVFALEGGERRMAGKVETMTELLHAAIVDLTLQHFYFSVSRADMAASHGGSVTATLQQIDVLLHTKHRPGPLHHTTEGDVKTS